MDVKFIEAVKGVIDENSSQIDIILQGYEQCGDEAFLFEIVTELRKLAAVTNFLYRNLSNYGQIIKIASADFEVSENKTQEDQDSLQKNIAAFNSVFSLDVDTTNLKINNIEKRIVYLEELLRKIHGMMQ